MRSIYTPSNHARGFTLIEAVVYIALLSGLTSAFIPYAYSIHEQDMQLLEQIQDAPL